MEHATLLTSVSRCFTYRTYLVQCPWVGVVPFSKSLSIFQVVAWLGQLSRFFSKWSVDRRQFEQGILPKVTVLSLKHTETLETQARRGCLTENTTGKKQKSFLLTYSILEIFWKFRNFMQKLFYNTTPVRFERKYLSWICFKPS